MEFTVADDDRKSESAYRKAEVLFFGRDTFAHIWFWTPYCQSCYIFGQGALHPWTPQQGHCPCTLPGPRWSLEPGLFPFFQNFRVSPMHWEYYLTFCFPWFWWCTDTVLYTVLGVQELQTDTVLYTVLGSERVICAALACHDFNS